MKSFAKLTNDLDQRGIVTKRRQTKVAKYNGGIPFTYGPLAHFLKNRVYVGEIGYKGKWFPGEHRPIIELATFEAVQALLAANGVKRKATSTASGAILMGKIYDDRGNRMRPTYSVKNGIRYRFYVSSALLRGRKDLVGSIGRVSAHEIETIVRDALRSKTPSVPASGEDPLERLNTITIHADHLILCLSASNETPSDDVKQPLRIPWLGKKHPSDNTIEPSRALALPPDPSLVQSVVRAHCWLRLLTDGTHPTVEALAEAINLHPKVVRLGLRLAWLSPDVTTSILMAGHIGAAGTLSEMSKSLALSWSQQAAGFRPA